MKGNHYSDNRRRRRKPIYVKKRRRRKRTSTVIAVLLICLILIAGAGAVGFFILQYTGELFAEDLCVASEDVSLDGVEADPGFHGEGLFNIADSQIKYGYKLFDKLYPASTTKVMTAYLALKYGNLDDVVTMSATSTNFNWDESTCGLSELMNTEAKQLGATGTHFVNPHGLHDENHYTTTYDLYLMFNEALKDQAFLDIISMNSYTAKVTSADGTSYTPTWQATNYYSAGEATPPDGIHVYGGKTGTTDQAGNCVILYEKNTAGEPYISVIMGASDKPLLYEEMNELLDAGMK